MTKVQPRHAFGTQNSSPLGPIACTAPLCTRHSSPCPDATSRTGSEFPVSSPDLYSIMDTSAIRHLETLVDGLHRQISGLRFRIEAIRTKTRAEARRRVSEIAHVYESYVPIEIFLARRDGTSYFGTPNFRTTSRKRATSGTSLPTSASTRASTCFTSCSPTTTRRGRRLS